MGYRALSSVPGPAEVYCHHVYPVTSSSRIARTSARLVISA